MSGLNMTYQEVCKKNMMKLAAAADYYTNLSPALARFYMSELDKMKKSSNMAPTPPEQTCPFCLTVFRPGNHHIRVIPKVKVNTRMQKLLGRQRENTMLGKFQRRLLELCTQRKNRMVYVCHTCNHRTVVVCARTSVPAITEKSQQTALRATVSSTSHKRLRTNNNQNNKLGHKAAGVNMSTTTVVEFGIPQYTSTPVVERKTVRTEKLSSASSAPSLLSVNTSSISQSSVDNGKQSVGKKTRGKKSHGTLRKMLAEQDAASRQGNSGSLKQFLSTL